MTSVVVLSDTHGNLSGLEKIDVVLAECDKIIHLGDTSSDASRINKKFGNKTIIINGNCDLSKLGDDEKVIEIEGVRIFATHGHLYSVKSTLARLAERAKSEGCRIALYGHTHCAREDDIDGVTLINPGNFSRYSKNGYCYIAVSGAKAVAKLVEIN